MHPANSTNVLAVSYEPSTRTVRVHFRSGGVYDYYGVDPHLFEQMLLPKSGRGIGRRVRTRPFTKVA